jgi:hypothetical protein
MKWFKNWIEKLKAELRSEKLTGKPGERGHVYVKTKGEVSISAKVYRAATGKWEDLGKIS